eukprot:gene4864-3485_t
MDSPLWIRSSFIWRNATLLLLLLERLISSSLILVFIFYAAGPALMPAAALCDGAPSALKAAEFAGFPSFFVGSTDQLILVHAWNPTRLLLFAGASAAQAMRDGGVSAPSSPSAGGVMSAAASGYGYQDLMAMAVASVSPEVVESQRQCLPVPYVLHAHIAAIKESKALKDFLNYKFETANVPYMSGPEVSKPDDDRPKKIPRASTARSTKEDIAPLKIQEPTAEEITSTAAALTAAYVRQRADHHKVNTLFLGVGNVMEGKSIRMGNTAEAVLRDLKDRFYLYFIKNDGFTLRHTTSLIRYVVVVTVDNGSPRPPPPPETEEQAGAGTGAAPLELAPSPTKGQGSHRLSDGDSTAHPSNGNHSKMSPPPSAQLSNGASSVVIVDPVGEVPPPVEQPPKVDALQDGLNAVRYALSRRRQGHKDAVAVLLVVEPQISEDLVNQYREVFEAEIAAAPDVCGEKETDEVPAPEEGKPSEEPAQIPPAPPAPADPSPAPPEAPPEVVAELAKLDEAWPPVSICTFKASKHVPQPTVWDSSAQLIKGLQQKKLEFAVIAESAPPPVLKTVLCHNKPHVIVPIPREVCADIKFSLTTASPLHQTNIYIYIYIERERERENESESKSA